MAIPKVVVVVAARLGSKRLPGKVLEDIDGWTMVSWVLDAARRTGYPVVLTIPEGDDFLAADSSILNQQISFGPENDLIKRHLLASEGYDHVVRVTSDCPFLDPWAARCTIDTHLEGGYDLTIDEAEGRGVQVYTRALLELMDRETTDPYEREHLDVWPLRRSVAIEEYRHPRHLNTHRMKFSVDTPAELDLARRRITL